MIDVALELVRNQLNDFVVNSLQIPGDEDRVHLCPIVDEAGRTAIPINSLGLSLINLQEDRVNQPSSSKKIKDSVTYLNTPSKITVYAILATNFSQYSEALKTLACVIEMIQSKPVLNPHNAPEMNKKLNNIILEICSYRLEELKDIWSFLGGRYHPSLVIKIKGIVVDAQQVQAIGSRVRGFGFLTRGKA